MAGAEVGSAILPVIMIGEFVGLFGSPAYLVFHVEHTEDVRAGRQAGDKFYPLRTQDSAAVCGRTRWLLACWLH